jgi:hypothetical protein
MTLLLLPLLALNKENMVACDKPPMIRHCMAAQGRRGSC